MTTECKGHVKKEDKWTWTMFCVMQRQPDGTWIIKDQRRKPIKTKTYGPIQRTLELS